MACPGHGPVSASRARRPGRRPGRLKSVSPSVFEGGCQSPKRVVHWESKPALKSDLIDHWLFWIRLGVEFDRHYRVPAAAGGPIRFTCSTRTQDIWPTVLPSRYLRIVRWTGCGITGEELEAGGVGRCLAARCVPVAAVPARGRGATASVRLWTCSLLKIT